MYIRSLIYTLLTIYSFLHKRNIKKKEETKMYVSHYASFLHFLTKDLLQSKGVKIYIYIYI